MVAGISTRLPRLPIQGNNSEGNDRVIYSMPGYECYCCNDSGFAPGHEFIENHDSRDPGVLCTRRDCNAKTQKIGDNVRHMLDTRVPPEACEELHRRNYNSWVLTIQEWNRRRLTEPGRDPIQAAAAEIYGMATGLADNRAMPQSQSVGEHLTPEEIAAALAMSLDEIAAEIEDGGFDDGFSEPIELTPAPAAPAQVDDDDDW